MEPAPPNEPRPRLLVFAYECEPGAGSEAGAGWALVEAALAAADCLVLTGPAHGPALREWGAAHAAAGLAVEVVPYAGWKRLAGFHRIGEFVAYLDWLRRAGRRARTLVAAGGVDAAWHATYSAYWLPAPAVTLGVPSVWGPVGGAVTIAPGLRPLLGLRGRVAERLDAVAVRAAAALPATRRTWERATVRLVQNEATMARLASRPHAATALVNHAEFVQPAGVHAPSAGAPVVWAGALERRKGPALAVRALAAARPGVRLRMYGAGPERLRVGRLARRLGVADRLELPGRVERVELLAALTTCGCALFTGLYEEGGLALAEALATGVPTVVLDHGGAGTIARRATDPERVVLVPPGGVAATARRMGEEISRLVTSPPPGRGPLLDRAAAVAQLGSHLRAAACTPPG